MAAEPPPPDDQKKDPPPSASAAPDPEKQRERVKSLWGDVLASDTVAGATLGSKDDPKAKDDDWRRRLPISVVVSASGAAVGVPSSSAQRTIADDDYGDRPDGTIQDDDYEKKPDGTIADDDYGDRPDATIQDDDYEKKPDGTIADDDYGDRPDGTIQDDDYEKKPDGTIADDDYGDKAGPSGKTALTRPMKGVSPPDFDIQKRLASGGMGDVFIAKQLGLDREVALKRPQEKMRGSDMKLGAFVREGTVTGDLEHPNIVPIYQNGIDDTGLPYYAMKLVRGVEWQFLLHPEYAKRRKNPEFEAEVRKKADELDLAGHIEILQRVCDAVAFAHSRNILHRDLKPENVIVGDFGEVQVMDWGLAIDHRDEEEAADSKALSRTHIRGPAGTAAYMAPEMALGENNKISIASDVYLLGAMLYEAITGRPPHHAQRAEQALFSAAANQVTDPLAIKPDAPRGLAEIAMRALSTDPADRQKDVRTFQDEIREYQTHAQSLKISDTATRSLKKLDSRRAEGVTAAEMSAMYSRYAEVVGSFRQALELWSGNADAQAGVHEAMASYVTAALDGGDLGLAQAQIDEFESAAGEADARVAELRGRWERLDRARRARQRNFRLAVGSAAALFIVVIVGGIGSYSKIMAEKKIAEDNFIEAEKQRGIAEEKKQEAQKNFVEAETQRGIAEEKKQEAQKNFAEAEKQRGIAEVKKKEALDNFAEAEKQRGIAEVKKKEALDNFAEAEKQRGIAEEKKKEAEHNFQEAERQREKAVLNLAEVDIQRARALVDTDRNYPDAATHVVEAIRIMGEQDTTEPRRLLAQIFQLSPQRLAVTQAAQEVKSVQTFGGDGEPFRVLLEDGSVQGFTLEGKLIGQSNGPTGVKPAALAPKSRPRPRAFVRLVADDLLDELMELDAANGKEATASPEPQPRADAGASGAAVREARNFTQWQGGWLVVNRDGRVFGQGRPVALPGVGEDAVSALATDAEGKRLAVGTDDGRLLLVNDVSAAKPLWDKNAHRGRTIAVRFRPGTRDVLSVGSDGRLVLWYADRNKPPYKVRGHAGYVSCLAVSPDGLLAATGGADGGIRVWKLTGEITEHAALNGHQLTVGAIAFHPKRPWLASQSWDGSIRLWDYSNAASPKLARLYVKNPDDDTLGVAISADGARLLCLASGNRLQLWDISERSDVTPKAWQDVAVRGARLVGASAEGPVLSAGTRSYVLAEKAKPQVREETAELFALIPAGEGRTVAVHQNGLVAWWPGGKSIARLEHEVVAVDHAGQTVVLGDAAGGVWQLELNDAAARLQTLAKLPTVGGVAVAVLSTGVHIAAWDPDGNFWIGVTGAAKGAGPQRLAKLPAATVINAQQAVWREVKVDKEKTVRELVVRNDDTILLRLDPTSGGVLDRVHAHGSIVSALSVGSSQRWMVTGGGDGQLRLWDLSERELRSVVLAAGLGKPVSGVLIDETTGTVACLLEDDTLRRFQLPKPDMASNVQDLRRQIESRLGIERKKKPGMDVAAR